jgi:hypothetical protein
MFLPFYTCVTWYLLETAGFDQASAAPALEAQSLALGYPQGSFSVVFGLAPFAKKNSTQCNPTASREVGSARLG